MVEPFGEVEGFSAGLGVDLGPAGVAACNDGNIGIEFIDKGD